MNADRNLLFGILALQLDFVSRDALIAAMHAWVLDKARPLGDILRDQGHLGPERLQLLSALMATAAIRLRLRTILPQRHRIEVRPGASRGLGCRLRSPQRGRHLVRRCRPRPFSGRALGA